MIKNKKRFFIISSIVLIVISVAAYYVVKEVSANKMSFRTPIRILHNPQVTWAEPEAEMRMATENNWIEIEPGLALDVNSYIRTGPYGNIDISFSEGTLIRVAENTLVSLSDLSLSRVEMSLEQGTLISKFRKIVGNESHRIITSEVVCGIRGTELIVEIGEKETIIYGMSGVTEVASVHHKGDSVLLGFQQKTITLAGEKPSSPEDMTAEEISHYRRILDSMHSLEVFFITSDIKFRANSPELIPESLELIEELASSIKKKKLHIEIVGHTADVGHRSLQYELSKQRAEAVKEALISLGIKENSLTTTGFGGSRPISDNDTTEGRALNRRVEFLIIQ